jgi:hypothetical protein
VASSCHLGPSEDDQRRTGVRGKFVIEGYPHEATVPAGAELQLHVSTDAPRFRVELFRVGATTAPVGYRVQHAKHWVYAATGVRDGDVFGGSENEALVGYECDGAHFDRRRLSTATAVTPTGSDGTPESFEILGVGDVGVVGWGLGNKAATLGVHHPGGTVFTAATTDWPRVLAHGNPVVGRITRNVLDRLAPSART